MRGFEYASSVPLAFAQSGSRARVLEMHMAADLKRHLMNLGLSEGADVSVVSKAGSDLVVNVKGSQIALDKHVALKVLVVPGN